MTIARSYRNSVDYWEPGNPGDPRLFHAEASDLIRVCPPQLGHGYFQHIGLRDDLGILILDYEFHRDLVIKKELPRQALELEFNLIGPNAGYNYLVPHLGGEAELIWPGQQRLLKVEIWLKSPTFERYFTELFNRLPDRVRQELEYFLDQINRHRSDTLPPSTETTLGSVLNDLLLPTTQ